MDHITAMKVLVSYLESAQKKGHFTIEDAAKIFNAQVVMNNYIMSNQNQNKEQDSVVKNENQVDNEVLNQLKNENSLLAEKLKEFEKLKVKLMSRNIELDNLRRNYNKKVEENNKLKETFSLETNRNDSSDKDENKTNENRDNVVEI